MTSRLLTPSRLLRISTSPLLTNTWYFIAAATLSVCNKPDEVPVLFKYAMLHAELNSNPNPNPNIKSLLNKFDAKDDIKVSSDPIVFQKQLEIAKKTREALMKGCALAGLPKTINSLTVLKNITPDELRETKIQRKNLKTVNEKDIEFGSSFWDQVYGKISKRVMGQLTAAYPDLGMYALNYVYTPLLSFTDVLSAHDTSLVVIACLIPQDVNPQLKGHLKGALNNGATKDEIDSARELSIDISKWCGINWTQDVAKL